MSKITKKTTKKPERKSPLSKAEPPKKKSGVKTLSPLAAANKKLKGTPEMAKRMKKLREMRTAGKPAKKAATKSTTKKSK